METIIVPIIQVALIALDLYMWCIIIMAILSWLVAFNVINTQNRFVYVLGDFLHRITEPALRPIRRFMPNLGGIDISPVLLILAIYLVQLILGNIARSIAFG